jgi:polyhydroxyalkanoate synthesis regulator protein
MDQPGQPVLIKRYAGRRFYRPAAGTYLTRGDLMAMAKNGENFVVIDAGTNEDVTLSYHPISVEH